MRDSSLAALTKVAQLCMRNTVSSALSTLRDLPCVEDRSEFLLAHLDVFQACEVGLFHLGCCCQPSEWGLCILPAGCPVDFHAC